jgi:hypothetical protein
MIRHNARRVGRGSRRGLDTRTIFVMRCPVTKEVYHIGYDPWAVGGPRLKFTPDRQPPYNEAAVDDRRVVLKLKILERSGPQGVGPAAS